MGEENGLSRVPETNSREHGPEFDVARNDGLRLSEMYWREQDFRLVAEQPKGTAKALLM